MSELLTLTGKISFDVEDWTKKHKEQSSWKKMAMVFMDGDITDYYAWFINKRYNLELNPPIRGAHVSFINDSLRDLSHDGTRSVEEIESIWNAVKNKWDGQTIPIVLDVSPYSSISHWWLNAPHDMNKTLLEIRKELGLSEPYYKLHMSIGYPNELNVEHSTYLCEILKTETIDDLNVISANRAMLLLYREMKMKSNKNYKRMFNRIS